jgi:hypothetical protein
MCGTHSYQRCLRCFQPKIYRELRSSGRRIVPAPPARHRTITQHDGVECGQADPRSSHATTTDMSQLKANDGSC